VSHSWEVSFVGRVDTRDVTKIRQQLAKAATTILGSRSFTDVYLRNKLFEAKNTLCPDTILQ